MIYEKRPADVIDMLICPYSEANRILVHQANCRCTLGAGLALQIAKRFPQVVDIDNNTPPSLNKLGTYSSVGVSVPGCKAVRGVYNVYAQDRPGPNSNNLDKRATSYDALFNGLWAVVRDWVVMTKASRGEVEKVEVLVPYKMGCGLAGGAWRIVFSILKEIDQRAVSLYPGKFTFIICQREGDE